MRQELVSGVGKKELKFYISKFIYQEPFRNWQVFLLFFRKNIIHIEQLPLPHITYLHFDIIIVIAKYFLENS